MAKATHVVTHKKLYLAVNGRLEHVEQGTELTLNAKQVERLAGKVAPIGETKSVDLSKVKAETPATDDK